MLVGVSGLEAGVDGFSISFNLEEACELVSLLGLVGGNSFLISEALGDRSPLTGDEASLASSTTKFSQSLLSPSLSYYRQSEQLTRSILIKAVTSRWR